MPRHLRDWWDGEDGVGRAFGVAAGVTGILILIGAMIFYGWLIIGVFLE